MSDPIYDFGDALISAHVITTTAQLGDRLANDLPADVRTTVIDGDIVLSGRNLVARYAGDVRLNSIAMTARAVLA